MKKILLFILPVMLPVLSSCIDNLACIRGDGFIETERRRVQDFDRVENTTGFDIVFSRSDTSGIAVIADGNIIDNIVTETSGSTLEIKTSPRDACFNTTQRPVIQISSPALKSVSVSGSGNFAADFMDGSEVSIRLSGSGDITAGHITSQGLSVVLSGSGTITLGESLCTDSDIFISGSGNINVEGECDESKMKISGSGNIYSSDFVTGTASVIISGSGNVYAHILESLTGIISGSGNIYVKGDPDVDVTVSGSGRVIKDDR